MENTTSPNLVHSLNQQAAPAQSGGTPPLRSSSPKPTGDDAEIPMSKTLMMFVGFIVVGVLTGFLVSMVTQASSGNNAKISTSNKEDVVKSAGIADKKTFKDSAEGTIRDGGHESGEGSFHMERPGGEDQTVYLTSSTIDMSEYVGKKVRVYGETFSSQHVGWLMDVGYIEELK